MKKALLLSAALVALTASLASAQGINLSLTDCGASGGRDFANPCNSNSGAPMLMVGSVIPAANVGQFVAIEAVLDGQTSQAVLSPWWDMGTGGCRATGALSLNADFTGGPFNCTDMWAGGGTIVGGIDPLHSAPNRFRVKLTCALPAPALLTGDGATEYYAFKVSILKAKTTGTGLCAGCQDACGIVLNEIRLDQPAGAGDTRIFNPANAAYCTYRGGIPNLPGATPTANRSWGQMKALYR